MNGFEFCLLLWALFGWTLTFIWLAWHRMLDGHMIFVSLVAMGWMLGPFAMALFVYEPTLEDLK